MGYSINRTETYHRENIETLGWELTVLNTLEAPGSPCRSVLLRDESFGRQLFSFLRGLVPLDHGLRTVLEVGGGYGFLMRDLLELHPSLKATMLDISPFLLGRQQATLAARDVNYELGDFFDVDPSWLSNFDFAIFNENMGDFPTVYNLSREEVLTGAGQPDSVPGRIAGLMKSYDLKTDMSPFSFNLGAVVAIEKLCLAEVPFIYVCEHSCEASPSEKLAAFLDIGSPGDPEAIRLYGHNEYSVKFSFLDAVGKHFGYETSRGPVADFLPLAPDKRLHFILASASQDPEHEEIRQFVHDLYKYEYLVLRKSGHFASCPNSDIDT